MPSFSLEEKLALACRILANEGHWDLDLGHVSARVPGEDLIIMKSMGWGLEEVTPENLVTIDLSGQKVGGHGSVHAEWPIHTEIYRARPDVGAVIHTHPPFATALGCTGKPLVPVSHDALVFTSGIPTFSLTPEMITTVSLGREVAQVLADKAALFLKNHGVVVVGPSVEEACVRAVLLEKAAHVQFIATVFGSFEPIASPMAEKMWKEKWSDFHLSHVWEYLVRKVRKISIAM